ncbi:MAG: hypothetical protein J0I20_12830 [Chloroflexi bacterium]|nr:hypothetical protein [Chloroflexota bacterium]OJV92590.1 MAG: hypothetical protein BGO39_32340 [Chloroflexi bacterium 54-19]
MTEPLSPAFQQFLESLEITDRQSLESYDMPSLRALQGKERERAEQILVDRLTQTDDPRAPRAILDLKLTRAVPALRQALKIQADSTLVEVANALWGLETDPSVVSTINDVLKQGELYGRVSAAYSLRDYPKEIVTDALFEAINDEDKLVRANAAASLYQLYGLNKWESVPGRGVMLLGVRLRSNFSSVRQEALKELKAIIKGKSEGKTAEELGLTVKETPKSPQALAFMQSLVSPARVPPWDENFDLEALGKLQGEEREWAIYSLLNFLEKQDVRAVRGLAYLKTPRALQPLQQALTESQGQQDQADFAAELKSGLAKLS